jgi:hypothetical protein
VRYEDLCAEPHRIMSDLLAHCDLPAGAEFLSSAAGQFHQPRYYRPRFSPAELAIIAEETSDSARRFGYDPEHASALRQSAQ